jgi:hypothetical protein
MVVGRRVSCKPAAQRAGRRTWRNRREGSLSGSPYCDTAAASRPAATPLLLVQLSSERALMRAHVTAAPSSEQAHHEAHAPRIAARLILLLAHWSSGAALKPAERRLLLCFIATAACWSCHRPAARARTRRTYQPQVTDRPSALLLVVRSGRLRKASGDARSSSVRVLQSLATVPTTTTLAAPRDLRPNGRQRPRRSPRGHV